ncbi:hypothetical protein [Stygiolobus azoricus]|uniref:hypothetical protein n=1 Tax=Stygiolobus azoricus TaxID=41675 RepID=UPI0012DE54D1|nr:hypothetical protein [Stygiolobus azoricus]
MLGISKSQKRKEEQVNIPLYDLSKLPEEYLRNEFPEVYNSLRRKYDVAYPYFY